MTTMPSPSTPATAPDIPPDWIDTVRATLDREGVAFRAGAGHATIEIQSINDGQFRPLTLPKGGVLFASAADRDLVLQQLHTHPSP